MTVIPNAIVLAAQASQAKWGIPASVSIAQWAIESGYGRHMPPGSNNPFGIKAVAGQPSVTVRTREEDRAGNSYYINAPFRKFASFEEAFDLHAKLLATARPYANARKKLPNAADFADALTGVYATAHDYGTVLKEIMRSANLHRYDDPARTVNSPVVRPELRLGSRGGDVEGLQRKLGILADGIFGGGTLQALLAFQRTHRLVADGIAGQKTWEALG